MHTLKASRSFDCFCSSSLTYDIISDEILKGGGSRGCPAAVVATAATAATATRGREKQQETDTRARSTSMELSEGEVHRRTTVPGTMQELSDPDLPAQRKGTPTTVPCDTRTLVGPARPGNVPGMCGEVGKEERKGEEAEGDEMSRKPAPAPVPVLPPKEIGTGATDPVGRRASTGSAGHKVGFLDRVKGEAKVISGKLGRNEKKVEEGRHLMGK